MKGNLYNRQLGENPLAGKILALLDLERKDFGRYRDVYLKGGGDRVIVYTRIGGKSAAFFLAETTKLERHPLFVERWDDSFDETYHYLTFCVGEGMLPQARELFKQQGGEPLSVPEKLDAVVKEMETMTREQLEKDPRFAEDIAFVKQAVASKGKIHRMYDDDMPKELQL